MALLAEDPEYRLARYAEEGLVELWARRLLKDLSEHPISEEDDVDYFSAYNNILQGWRYIQRQRPPNKPRPAICKRNAPIASAVSAVGYNQKDAVEE